MQTLRQMVSGISKPQILASEEVLPLERKRDIPDTESKNKSASQSGKPATPSILEKCNLIFDEMNMLNNFKYITKATKVQGILDLENELFILMIRAISNEFEKSERDEKVIPDLDGENVKVIKRILIYWSQHIKSHTIIPRISQIVTENALYLLLKFVIGNQICTDYSKLFFEYLAKIDFKKFLLGYFHPDSLSSDELSINHHYTYQCAKLCERIAHAIKDNNDKDTSLLKTMLNAYQELRIDWRIKVYPLLICRKDGEPYFDLSLEYGNMLRSSRFEDHHSLNTFFKYFNDINTLRLILNDDDIIKATLNSLPEISSGEKGVGVKYINLWYDVYILSNYQSEFLSTKWILSTIFYISLRKDDDVYKLYSTKINDLLDQIAEIGLRLLSIECPSPDLRREYFYNKFLSSEAMKNKSNDKWSYEEQKAILDQIGQEIQTKVCAAVKSCVHMFFSQANRQFLPSPIIGSVLGYITLATDNPVSDEPATSAEKTAKL